MKKVIMTISHIGRNRYIMLNRYSIIMLGVPQYICMLMGNDKQSLAFAPCEEKHAMSFKVPDDFMGERKPAFKIHSKSFVDKLVKANNFEDEMTHNIEGVYNEGNNCIIFPLKIA